jgi:single-strand DNA-binding protein
MSEFNRVFLMGYLGNSPELKQTPAGKPYVRLSIATHAQKEDESETTYWHRVVVFGNQAENCHRYLQAGSSVLVEGALEPRAYSAKSGERHYSNSIVAQRIQFLGGRMRAKTQDAEHVVPADDLERPLLQTN